MAEQLIIAVGREYGSGGHEIAKELANRFHIAYYDRNLLDEVAKEKNLDVDTLKEYDESPRKIILSRTVRGFSNSPEDVIAEMQFNFLKEKAEAGESFVVVGRCAEYVLRYYDSLVSIFVTADQDVKIKRIMETRSMTQKEAEAALKRHDKNRKSYYARHTNDHEWGYSSNYNLCINSSTLGMEKTTDFIEKFVKEFHNK
jgi:cytidylate kinase